MVIVENHSINGCNDLPILMDLTLNDIKKNAPLVIFVHGFKGFKDWGAHHLVARFFALNGYRYLKFNFSHSGVNPQKPSDITDKEAFAANTFSKEMLDIDLVIKYAVEMLNANSIFLIGHSRGGALGILQAANNPYIKALITWSAISTFNSLWKIEQEEEWRKEGKIFIVNARTKDKIPLNVTLLEDFEQNKMQFDILAKAKQISVPWLIVHGADDVNVSFKHAQKLNQANLNSRLAKIKGANHVYDASHPYEKETLPTQLFQVCDKSLMFLNEVLLR